MSLLRSFSTGIAQVAGEAIQETKSQFFKVKLCRGFIGLPQEVRERATTLGLTRKGQIRYVPVIPETMGAILKLKELIKLELVDEIKDDKKKTYPKGYQVINSYLEKPNASN